MTEKIKVKDEQILKAAAKCFAINGFSGARVDEIAAEAGVNKATLYYRIGDKAAIYDRIFTDMLKKVIENIKNNIASVNKTEDKIRGHIRAIAEVCDENLYLSPFILREVASGGAHMSEETLKSMHEVRGTLGEILQQGIDQKEFHNVNPFLIHMIIIGTLNFYSASQPIRNKMPDTPSAPLLNIPIMEIADNISELILNSIRVN